MPTNLISTRPWRLVATAVVMLATTGLAACDLGTPSASAPPATATPAAASGSPAASEPRADGLCQADALAVTGGPWSAAAGSRGAEILVQNQGTTACSLPATAEVAIVDSASQPLTGTEPAAGAGPTLEPGASARFMLLFGNWCDEAAALPLHVVVQAADAGVQVQGLDLAQADLPPCNGPGDPPLLTAQPWTTG